MATYDTPGVQLYKSPAISGTIIGTGGNGNHRGAYIDASGNMWVAFNKNSGTAFAGLYVAYSSDNGSTWTEELVEDVGSWGSISSTNQTWAFSEANNGDIIWTTCLDSGTHGLDRYHIFRRTAANTWVYQTSIYGNSSSFSAFNHHGYVVYNHPNDDNKWILIGPRLNGDVEISYWISSDNLASFGSPTSLYSSTGNRSNQVSDRGGVCVLRNADKDKIAVVTNAQISFARLLLYTISDWDTSPTVSSTQITSFGSTNYAYLWVTAAWSATDSIKGYATLSNTSSSTDVWYFEVNDVFGTPTVAATADTTHNDTSTNDKFTSGYLDETNEIFERIGLRSTSASWRRCVFQEDAGNEGTFVSHEDFTNGETPYTAQYLMGQNQILDNGYQTDRFGPLTGISLYVVSSDGGGVEGFYYLTSSDLLLGSGPPIPPEIPEEPPTVASYSFFTDLNLLDRSIGEKRNSPMLVELYGGSSIQISYYEPDANTFRDKYYYNSRLNRLYKKVGRTNLYFWKPISEAN